MKIISGLIFMAMFTSSYTFAGAMDDAEQALDDARDAEALIDGYWDDVDDSMIAASKAANAAEKIAASTGKPCAKKAAKKGQGPV